MFEQSGIGVDDLAWIHRDQFVHYVELAHASSDPGSWPRFRKDLMRALTAAFGLHAGDTHGGLTSSQRRALDVLDEIRPHHDPETDWPAFFDALWSRRHAIRPDLPDPPLASRGRTDE
jgi:hypothetical protein